MIRVLANKGIEILIERGPRLASIIGSAFANLSWAKEQLMSLRMSIYRRVFEGGFWSNYARRSEEIYN